MKKTFSVMMAGILCVPTVLLSACSTSEKRDETKTQLDISYFAGGFGEDWINQAKKEFEQKYANVSLEEGKTGVQVWIDPHKDIVSVLEANIKAGTKLRDLYFTTGGNLRGLIDDDLVEPITDVYKSKPDGENGETIEEKLLDKDNVVSVYGNGLDAYYALPYTQAIIGLVFDYNLFVEKEWLSYADATDLDDLSAQGFTYTETTNAYGTDVIVMQSYNGTERITYKQGDIILKAGKDGKFGSHDDGQPQDVEEWNYMLSLIAASEGTKPFIYASLQPDYLDPIAEAIFAQYDGIDNYEITYDYDGTYTSPSTHQQTQITLETGCKVWEFEGRQVALEFIDNNLGNANYLHPSTDKLGRTAIDIQSEYVLGYKGTAINPLSSMIVEGIWWENESRGLFNSLADSGEKERGYGARDYRYMLYPAFENQKGIDGNGNGTVFSSYEDGTIFVRKGASAASKTAAKEFIKFVMSDDWLARFTTMTGGMRPFDYSLTNEQYNGLTPFQKHVWNIYHDYENYKVVVPKMMLYSQPINHETSKTVTRWETVLGSTTYKDVIAGLRSSNGTVANYMNGMKTSYSSSVWSTLVSQVK